MILVNCAWRQEDIIKAVESLRVDEQNAFKVIKVEGIRIFFDTFLEDIKAVKMIKNAIKKNSWISGAIYRCCASC